MNQLHREMLGQFATEIGQPLCDLLVKGKQFASNYLSKDHNKRTVANTELLRAASFLSMLLEDWEPFGLSLEDLQMEEDAPNNFRLAKAARELFERCNLTDEEYDSKTLNLRQAAIALSAP